MINKFCNSSAKITYVLLLSIIVLNIGLKFYNLDYPTWFYYDEVYFGYTATEFAKGNFKWDGEKDLDREYIFNYQYSDITPEKYEKLRKMPWGKSRKHEQVAFEWTHPPLGKEITSLGVFLFGNNPIGWRSMPALFGILGCITIFLLGKELFKSNTAGIFASILYTFDQLILVESRASLTDIYLINLILLSSYFFIRYLRSERCLFLILTGVFCGLGFSIKWTGAFPPALFSLIIFFYYWNDERRNNFQPVIKWIGDTAVIFLILVVCYLLSYLPFFIKGMGISEFADLHLSMFNYHKSAEEHLYQSQWWSWPLILKPARFMHNEFGNSGEYIYAIGNPVLWWGGLTCMIYGIYLYIKEQFKPLGFALLSYVFFMIPWALSPRDVTFIYHYLPSLIFLILATAYIMARLWNKNNYSRAVVISFILLVIAAYIQLAPISYGTEIKMSELESYLWFDSWK